MRRSTRDRVNEAVRLRARTRLLAVGLLVAMSVLAIAAFTLGNLTPAPDAEGSAADPAWTTPPDQSSAPASQESSETAIAVEVPDLLGKTLAEAHVLLEATGVTLQVEEDPSLVADAVGDARIVERQEPVGSTVVNAGDVVRVTVAAVPGTSTQREHTGAVVVIDPGHQAHGDSSHEPIGPGSDRTKPKVTGGTTGVVTRMPEYEIVLQISMNLKARLESAGVTVVMTRMTNDVNISNSERAGIANDAQAELFIRVHADGSTDTSQAGVSMLYPGKNDWTEPISGPSHRAAELIHDAVVASTGGSSRGLVERNDLSGFNWSTVPTVLVECGFLTNPVEDRLLSSPHYQDKLAEGMATGIIAYLNE